MKIQRFTSKRSLIIAGIVCLAGVLVFITLELHNAAPKSAHVQRINAALSQSLEHKDYQNYQALQLEQAREAEGRDDYHKAERDLRSIATHVPSEQINFETDIALATVYKHQGDKDNYRRYLSSAIAKLRKQGFPKTADYYQSQLAKG